MILNQLRELTYKKVNGILDVIKGLLKSNFFFKSGLFNDKTILLPYKVFRTGRVKWDGERFYWVYIEMG